MIILADENIPNVKESFAGFGEVRTAAGRDICADMLTDVDALLVRSVTSVNETLLVNSKVRFVGSATTGIDHIDTQFLHQASIKFCSAHGANARSVTEYVLAVLALLRSKHGVEFFDASVGIIGLGKVGGGLYRTLSSIGLHCIAYDPLIDQDSFDNMAELDDVLGADIVCLHTPLTSKERFATAGMIGKYELQKLKPNAVLINAGRGEVVNNHALLKACQANSSLIAVLDVWQNEPAIAPEVLAAVHIATPHIAGYSFDGKLSAAQILKTAFCGFYGFVESGNVSTLQNKLVLNIDTTGDARDVVCRAILAAYPIQKDEEDLRRGVVMNKVQLGKHFDSLRKNYWQRREFSQYTIPLARGSSIQTAKLLSSFGFKHQRESI